MQKIYFLGLQEINYHMSENWDKEKIMIAELKTDVNYIREDINLMQKQIRDLSTSANMGIGGLKVALFIGALLGGLYTFMKFLKQEKIWIN